MPKGIGYPFGKAARKVGKAALKGAALGAGVAKLKRKKKKKLSFREFLKKHGMGANITQSEMKRMRSLFKRRSRAGRAAGMSAAMGAKRGRR